MNHIFDIEHASRYGLQEAILISNFEFWIAKNVGNARHEHDGRTWTYNSVRAFGELFPYLTAKQIRRAIDSLVAQNVLMRGEYNDRPADKTSWYAFTDEYLAQNPLPCRANGVPTKADPLPSKANGLPKKANALPSRANGSARKGKSLEGTDVNPDVNADQVSDAPSGASGLPAAGSKKGKTEQPMSHEETALQAACRQTWKAYSEAYAARYAALPVRNATINAKVKQFVQRIGYEESPAVATYFVSKVNESFVVRKFHEVGLLLNGAETYRTQWATGQSMTSARANQVDKSQSNFDTAAEAMAIIQKRRGAQHE